MTFKYLILAHLLGDFVLQPTKLVEWKRKSFKGLFVHSAVHVILYFLLLLPLFLGKILFLAAVCGGIGVLHFFIDGVKISYDYRTDKKVTTFVLDQLMHLLTLILAHLVLSAGAPILGSSLFYDIYGNQQLIFFIVLLILFTTVAMIFNFERERQKNGSAKLKLDKKKIEKRIIVVTLLYTLFILVGKLFQ